MSINRDGTIKENNFSSTLLCQYDPNIYIEPDGSGWIKIIRQNNPSKNLFVSTDSFTTHIYKNKDLWFNASLCNNISGTWELMIKQTLTLGGTEYKYRWKQTANPLTCSYDSVAPAKVTYNTLSGYTSTTYGGLRYHNTNTYLSGYNGNSGNWWGAFGVWTAYSGGLPGWNGQVITTGYMDLYLRVDNLNINNTQANLNKMGFIAHDFYEI